MTANRRNTRVPEQEARQIPGALIAAVLFGALTLFTLYLILFVTDGGALSGARAFLKGLCGHLYVVFPLVPLWLCVLCAFRATGRKVAVWRIIANLGLVVCFYSAVQLFFCEGVELANLNGQGTPAILSWADFVAKSYRFGKGGGALGAMLAGPLYHYLGKALGLIAILLLAALLMAITGKIGKMARMVKKGSHDAEQRRLERRNDDMFNTDTMLDNAFNDRRPSRNVPRNAPRSSTPNRGRRLYKEDLEPRAAQARTTEPRAEAASVAPEQPTRTERIRPAAYPDSEAPRTAANRRRSVDYDESDVPTTEPVPEAPVVEAVPEPEEPPKPVRMPRKPSKADSVSEKKASSAPVEQINLDDLRIEPDAYEDESPEAEVRPEPTAALPKLKRSAAAQEPEEEDAYNYPPIDLLAPAPRGEALADNNADLQKAKLLEETLRSFGISTKLTGIAHGPAVTRFELQPAPGVKVSRITSLADDIALNLAAISVRIEAPIPGKAAVGVEVPNDKIETVALRDVLESNDARKHPSRIAVGLGKDNSGRFIIADVAKMPHVLIAGQTGSGKSVCINSIIVSILYRSTPDEVRLILIDPKVVELSVYNGIPHLIAPVVTDPKKAASALDWAVVEMTNRYKKFAERGVRDMKGYNKALREGEKPMPHMVIIIDELADLMMVSPGEVEDSICRLAQLARAAGMHLVIATQRPSVNVITGIIKANIPTRIAFLVASQVDSRTIIDHGGAEKLLGHGDMLYVPAGIQKPMRVQGSWVSDEEVHSIVEFIKERHEADYDEDVLEHINNAVLSDAEKEEVSDEYDPRLPEAIEIVMEAGQASISMLQRRMRVGYARAGRLIDEMSQRGIVSEADGAKPRTVLITREQFNQMFEDEG